ncbi:kinesin-like protein KIF20A [Protopterus annectens]|uniref:kinesin-like protein KIF20A n=1 Tax=Protopterus annectens TaxID=7888 RepID=UPI001CFAA675|nr:kinesin-like protein KIF20A [Protopterus annectens]
MESQHFILQFIPIAVNGSTPDNLTWINVCNLEEACRILKIGNKNRSLACTKLNQQSSRSHSIFSVKLLRISKEDNPQVLRISQLSLCDLAGSERCNKTETIGDRLKEAGNINNSLLILGKCIAALRQNQHTKVKQNCIPFRESKLTRLFQAFFCGKGKACMIVNINQCASLYDETLHVMKFSAVARQVVQTIQPKSLTFLTPRLVGKDGKPISKTESVDALSETYISDDDLLDSEDDVDTSILESKDLLKIIDSLKEKLITERQNKLVLEAQIRNEMGEAMLQQLMETEEMWSKRLEELKESYEEKMDSRFDMYKEAVKRHARLSAQKEVTQNYVTMEEFLAEQKKVLERDRRISMLEAALDACRDPEGMSSFFGCSMLKETEPCDTVLNEAMMEKDLDTECDHKELCSIVAELEQQCEKKDKVIETLRTEIEQQSKSLHAIEQTLKEKIVETDDMKKTMEEKEIGFKCAKQTDAERILELENSISELKEILDATKKVDLPSDNDVPPKRKKGLFANLKSSMAATSPKRYALRQALSKSVLDTPTSSRKQKGQKVDEQNI